MARQQARSSCASGLQNDTYDTGGTERPPADIQEAAANVNILFASNPNVDLGKTVSLPGEGFKAVNGRLWSNRRSDQLCRVAFIYLGNDKVAKENPETNSSRASFSLKDIVPTVLWNAGQLGTEPCLQMYVITARIPGDGLI
ncbi:hypothetical protein CIRG_08227 [Coccidioides immitis RMSCC 2394]|uniref:Uncharacterized protein n=1 Tax=Coccidioides immitis RMSCC 2394 TaxID=404692 RepID=A0A0J6YIS7_COCIT|nr:hypothetical protein CIRG_08227 [Coccidioides immitis RMSCC 2394]